MFAPVELPAVDDDSANGCAVACRQLLASAFVQHRNSHTSNPLRGRVNNNVCAMVDGSHEISARTESIVNYNRDTSLMRNRSDLLEVRHIVLWVADTLELSLLSAEAYIARDPWNVT